MSERVVGCFAMAGYGFGILGVGLFLAIGGKLPSPAFIMWTGGIVVVASVVLGIREMLRE